MQGLGPEANNVLEQLAQMRQQVAEQGLSQTIHQRLVRYNAIETGQIEGLYKVSRGSTESLIEQGIKASLISHEDTGGLGNSEQIAQQMQDQQAVLEGLFAVIKEQPPLSLAGIRGLHAQLCANQSSVRAKDSLGNWQDVELLKGEWKQQPNNPRREDGRIFCYCPPEEVQQEMQELVDCYHQGLASIQQLEPEQGQVRQEVSREQSEEGQASAAIRSLVLTAWLHHRFTLIHPFQDGNGRMVRVLASMLLIKQGYYPLLVRSEDRASYIQALEQADCGRLQALAEFILHSQQQSLHFAQQQLSQHQLQQRKVELGQLLAQQEEASAEWQEQRAERQRFLEALLRFVEGELREIFQALQQPPEIRCSSNDKGTTADWYIRLEHISEIYYCSLNEAAQGGYRAVLHTRPLHLSEHHLYQGPEGQGLGQLEQDLEQAANGQQETATKFSEFALLIARDWMKKAYPQG